MFNQYGRGPFSNERSKFSALARDFKEMCGKRSKITAPRIQNRDAHKPEYLYYICRKKNQSRLLSSKIIIITNHNHCTINVAMWSHVGVVEWVLLKDPTPPHPTWVGL